MLPNTGVLVYKQLEVLDGDGVGTGKYVYYQTDQTEGATHVVFEEVEPIVP